jgi:hypothetical protein
MSTKIVIDARLRWPDVQGDYAVEFEGHSIGRVRFEAPSWLWSITIPMAVPEWAEGTASTRDEAFKALATAWGRLLNQTSPARLQRAWELDKAFEVRQPIEVQPDQPQP